MKYGATYHFGILLDFVADTREDVPEEKRENSLCRLKFIDGKIDVQPRIELLRVERVNNAKSFKCWNPIGKSCQYLEYDFAGHEPELKSFYHNFHKENVDLSNDECEKCDEDCLI